MRTCEKSGCSGFRRKLCSRRTTALGTTSTADSRAAAQLDPICCALGGGGSDAQFPGSASSSSALHRLSSNSIGMLRYRSAGSVLRPCPAFGSANSGTGPGRSGAGPPRRRRQACARRLCVGTKSRTNRASKAQACPNLQRGDAQCHRLIAQSAWQASDHATPSM